MWAMIPMFRVRTSGYSRMTRGLPVPPGARLVASLTASIVPSFLAGVPIATSPSSQSPSVVSERLVRFGHLVHVLAALHRGALATSSVHDLRHQAIGHRMLLA